MPRVRLLHWNRQEAAPYLEILGAQRYRVEYDERFEPALMREWRTKPPQAFVIDLSRLPSHGREIAVALRKSPATRAVPIVFCEGADDKVSRVRKELPDAFYCTLASLPGTLKRALASPPADPVIPAQMMERYATRSAPEKLGIRVGSRLAAIDAPRDFPKLLGELPRDVEILEDETPGADVILCFVRDFDGLQTSLSQLRGFARTSKLWILWPKGQSNRGGIGERAIRESAIALGLVDYKICSVDKTWSAMLFALKR
jgi:CheY-like chemotaxis protein